MINNLVHRSIARSVYQLVIDNYQKYFPASLKLDFTTGALDPRITFSRATNATVTRSDGTIGYAPHNLLTYSEQFDNATWTKTTTTVTANAIASPTSTTTGDTLTASGANSTTLHSYTAIAQPYTFSIYIRRRTGTGTIEITADGSTYVAKTITSEWARFDTTITPTAGTRTPGVRIVTSGDAIDVWGAQLEIGSTATTYNSTTVKNLLGYSELFDNAAWTKFNSFVQANLLTYSEAFDNTTGWGKSNITVTANNLVAPNGYQTADTLVATGVSTTYPFENSLSASAGTYTFSVYSKLELSASVLCYGGGGIGFIALIDSSTKALSTITYNGVGYSGVTGSVTPTSDGWYRISVTFISTITTSGATLAINKNKVTVWGLSNSGSIGDSLSIWGAQLVQGSVAGDYRRTDAAALPCYYPNHNGVVCAEQLHGTAANGTILESYTATGGSMTFSLWMRRITGTGNVDITMDTGVTWTTQSITTSWARYSITSTPTAGARTAGVRLVTSGDVVQVFGGMVSDSASLDPYVLNAAAAPTAAAYYGARFDYDPVTLAPKGLLIEEQRVNLLLNSKLDGTDLATQSVTVTAVAHTLSFYGTGTVTLSGTAVAVVAGTGAYPTRTTLTFTPTAGVVLFTVTGTVQYAQLEIGSFATSYIPTAASQVTRAADIATIQGSNFYSWYNQNEGSFAVQFSFSQVTAYPSPFSIDDGVTLGNISSNRLQFYQNLTSTALGFESTTLGTSQANITFTGLNLTTNTKGASAYKVNDFSAAANNILGTPDTSGITGIYNRLIIGRASPNPTASCIVKSISYYPTRLSNDVLKGLTA